MLLSYSGYRQALNRHNNDEEEAMLGGGQISEDEKYQDCDRFKFNCLKCGREIIVDGVFSSPVSVVLIIIANSTC